MCLSPAVIDERVDRLNSLLSTLRTVTITKEEGGVDDAYTASLFLINEVEVSIKMLAGEMKACPDNDGKTTVGG